MLSKGAALCLLGMAAGGPSQFGHVRKDDFLLTYLNFNHGSFGSAPKSVLAAQSSYRHLQEERPDVWFRGQYQQMVNDSVALIANYTKAPGGPSSVVLVENASGAVNSIMRSLSHLRAGDIFMYFSVAYGMVKNTAQWLKENMGIRIIEVPVTFPILEGSEERAFAGPLGEALGALTDAELQRLRLVVLDHISSIPAVVEPVARCASLVKSFAPSTLVLVDGAHVAGQMESLDISSLGPIDVYLSNGHKWLYSPKGSAFMWVNDQALTPIFPEPTVVSSENAPGTVFTERFIYTGTRDYTPFIAMKDALEYRNQLGGDSAIFGYVHNLATEAARTLTQMWGTSLLAPMEISPMMFNVVLPTNDTQKASAMQNDLLSKHNIYMITLQEPVSGLIYSRLSAQIYLELSDFQLLGQLVLDYLRGSDAKIAV